MKVRPSMIRNIPLFSELTDAELDLITASVRQVSYPKGNIVFYEGDPGEFLLIVLSGKVKVVLLGESGQEINLATLGEGSFVGEMSLLDGAPRSATVVTLDKSTLLQLPREQFLELIWNHQGMAMKILLSHMSRRIREADEYIRTLSMFDVYGRTVRCLIRLAQQQGVRNSERIVISDRPSHKELASMINCSRESVTRAMTVLQENGYVSTTKTEIILERRALEHYWYLG